MTTSINFHFRPSQAECRRPGKLFIRVIRNRQSRHISREYAIFADEWDAEKKKLILPPANVGYADRYSGVNGGVNSCVAASGKGVNNNDRFRQLTLISESMKNDLKRLHEIVTLLGQIGEFSASDIVDQFVGSLNGDTVSGYAEIVGGRLREKGADRTARAYRTAARSLTNFNGGKEVLLSEIDGRLMSGYEQHLLGKGLALNTVSFYLRNLRALYFRAVAERLIPEQLSNPFAGTHTGVYETRRRALDSDQLRSLAVLETSLLERMEALARPEAADAASFAARHTAAEELRKTCGLYDSLLYFLFCYHARGMSFVDMAHLRRQDIDSEILTYRRRKTGRQLEVKVTEPMRRILSRFAPRTGESEFAFPVIDPSRGDTRRQYETGLKRQNRLLKVLAHMAGITENLSTHAARHTWATLAKRLHVPVAVIGEALGHRDVKTTSIYLASFDRATMDELSVRLSDAVKAA